MKRYYFLFLTLCLVTPTLIYAQQLEKAQLKMATYDYVKAIKILTEASKDEKTKKAALPMLAECYRLQHDIANCKATYAQVVALPGAEPSSFYYYAQALQSTGDYASARDMIQKYADKNPSDPASKLFAASCDSVMGPWKSLSPQFEIKTVDKINTIQSDFGPAICDGDLVFASDYRYTPGEGKQYGWTGNGFLDIKKASPVISGDFWGNLGSPSDFERKFNQEYHDGPAAFSADGKSIFFTRSIFGKAKREGNFKTNMLKIYYATKTDGAWGEVKPFIFNSNEYSIGHPTLSADGQSLYFASDMPGGQGKTDIWMCKREGNSWSHPVNLGPLVNTRENEMFPTMRSDGVLFFASDGHAGYGAMDIFRTEPVKGQWTTPVNLQAPINSSYDDFAIVFAPGYKNGFFSSNRPGGMGNDDIYAFRVPEPPIPVILPAYVCGMVKDKTTLQPITGATVFLLNTRTGMVSILKSGTDGMFKSFVEDSTDYAIKAMMPNYIPDFIHFPMAMQKPGTTTNLKRDLLLDKLVINKTFNIENIYYDFDKYEIRKDAMPELIKLVQLIKENQMSIELESHTDSRGNDQYNKVLSQKRAESVVNYIVQQGIETSRIKAKGYGESRLTNQCANGVKCSAEEHQANRRTMFKVLSFKIPDDKNLSSWNMFIAGEEVPLNKLGKDFFTNSLSEKKQPEVAPEISEATHPAERSLTPAKPNQVIQPIAKADPNTFNAKALQDNQPLVDHAVTYRVQFYSLSKFSPIDSPEFAKLRNVQFYKKDGQYKYTAGIFNDASEAIAYRSIIAGKYPDAFVVAFKDGLRVKFPAK